MHDENMLHVVHKGRQVSQKSKKEGGIGFPSFTQTTATDNDDAGTTLDYNAANPTRLTAPMFP